jgi:hypothetical protein
MTQQIDSEKYLDALLEVVYDVLYCGFPGYPGVATLMSYITQKVSPETFEFLRYNGLTAEYVMDWLKRRSEKESKG